MKMQEYKLFKNYEIEYQKALV